MFVKYSLSTKLKPKINHIYVSFANSG